MKIVKLAQTLFWKHNELSAAGLVERLLQVVASGKGSALVQDFAQYGKVMNKYHRNKHDAKDEIVQGFLNWATGHKKSTMEDMFFLEVMFCSWFVSRSSTTAFTNSSTKT